MKKFSLYLFLLLFAFGGAFAQQASERQEKSPAAKGTGNAVVIELEGQAKNVEDVLSKKFKKYKTKKEKGYVAIKGQIVSEIATNVFDIYYKVEKAKKGDNTAKIIFFISLGYDNYLSSAENPTEIQNTINMLNALVNEVRRYELELAIKAQEKVVAENIKTQENLVKDHEKLEKEHEKLEKELAENEETTKTNESDQEAQKGKIEDEKKVLGELQNKLKGIQ